MAENDVSYKAFWEALLPQSNRRTGFSIRHAAKRNWVSFQLVGFQFTYKLDWLEPDATLSFEIRRSDAEAIFDQLLQQQSQIYAAFATPLRWVRAFPPLDAPYPVPALVTSIALRSG